MSWEDILKQEKISLYKGDLESLHRYVMSGEFKEHMAAQFDKEDTTHKGMIVGHTGGKGNRPQEPLLDKTFTGVGLDDYVMQVEMALTKLGYLGYRENQPFDVTVEFIFMPMDSVMANMDSSGFPHTRNLARSFSREFQEINASEY